MGDIFITNSNNHLFQSAARSGGLFQYGAYLNGGFILKICTYLHTGA